MVPLKLSSKTVLVTYWVSLLFSGAELFLVEFWGLPPLIPLLQCVNWLGLRFVLWTELLQNKEAWLR